MKVKTNELKDKLVAPFSVVPTRPLQEVYENFLVEVKGNEASITGASEGIALTTKVNVESAEDVSFLINADKLVKIVSALNDEELRFDLSKNAVVLNTKRGKYKLPRGNVDDFILPDREDVNTSLNMAAETLKYGMKSVVYAAPGEGHNREDLNGVAFDLKETPCLVGTDSSRVSICKFNDMHSEDTIYVLQKRTAEVLTKLLGTGDVKLELNKSTIYVEADGFSLMSLLLSSKYVNYKIMEKVVGDKTVEVNQKDLLATLKRIHVFSNSMFDCGTTLKFKQGMIEVSVEHLGKGENAFETVDCVYDGEDVTVQVSSEYLKSAIDHVSCDTVCLLLKDNESPIVVRPKEDLAGTSLIGYVTVLKIT